jgi:hypothetical protein
MNTAQGLSQDASRDAAYGRLSDNVTAPLAKTVAKALGLNTIGIDDNSIDGLDAAVKSSLNDTINNINNNVNNPNANTPGPSSVTGPGTTGPSHTTGGGPSVPAATPATVTPTALKKDDPSPAPAPTNHHSYSHIYDSVYKGGQ